MTVSQTIAQIQQLLVPKFGQGEARAMCRFIFERLKGWTLTDIAFHGADELSEFIYGKAIDAARRALADEPLQYIFNSAYFYGMDLKVTPATLIPRPETAELVDMIVSKADGRADLRVLDLGTGSGCIAIALARNLRFPEVTAVDISADALEVARENAATLKARISFLQADMLKDNISGEYDIIVSNPPYIADSEAKVMEANVILHEPHTALFVPDSDPLIFYKAIAQLASYHLVAGGRLYLEINPLFADDLRQMLLNYGFADIEIHNDSQGRKRFATATR